MCEKRFDYKKYIWQIQFQPIHIISKKHSYNTTIDYLNKVLTIRRTDLDTNRTKTVELTNKNHFEKLLSLSEISKIREFENKSADELRKLERGYRDGWSLRYYYMHGDSHVKEGTLGTVYQDNPIEEIDEWIHQYVSYDEVGF